MIDKQYFVFFHALILGYAKVFLTMFVKRKKNRSGTTSVVVAEKTKGIYKELITIGVAKDSNEIDSLVNAGHKWISKEESRRHPQLDLYGEERGRATVNEKKSAVFCPMSATSFSTDAT